jgi:hypothetical protein
LNILLFALNSCLSCSFPFRVEYGELSDVVRDVDFDDFEVWVGFIKVLSQLGHVAVGLGHVDQHQSSKEKAGFGELRNIKSVQ